MVRFYPIDLNYAQLKIQVTILQGGMWLPENPDEPPDKIPPRRHPLMEALLLSGYYRTVCAST